MLPNSISSYSLQTKSTTQQLNSIQDDTISALNNAGYDAYAVNASSFSSVENTLNTDLGSLGLSPDSSYIVVIDDNSQDSNASPAAVGVNPSPIIDEGSGGITYTHDGIVYLLRYITVTSLDAPEYGKTANLDLMETYGEDFITRIADFAISYFLDKINEKIHIGTILSLFGCTTEQAYTNRHSELELNAAAAWSRSFIQVWNEDDEVWEIGSCAEMVTVLSYYDGMILNETTATYDHITYDEVEHVVYSNDYNNHSKRRQDAVEGFLTFAVYDTTGHAEILIEDDVVITLPHNFL